MIDFNPILTKLTEDIRKGVWTPTTQGSGTMSDNEKGSSVDNAWYSLSSSEKVTAIIDLITSEKLTDEILINVFIYTLQKITTDDLKIVSRIDDECGICGISIGTTTIIQLDRGQDGSRLIAEMLPTVVCSECAG